MSMKKKKAQAPEADEVKVPVTLRGLIQRINRKLREPTGPIGSLGSHGEVLKKSRGMQAYLDVGDYYTIDRSRNVVVRKEVDPVKLAHELGVLQSWETVAGEAEMRAHHALAEMQARHAAVRAGLANMKRVEKLQVRFERASPEEQKRMQEAVGPMFRFRVRTKAEVKEQRERVEEVERMTRRPDGAKREGP